MNDKANSVANRTRLRNITETERHLQRKRSSIIKSFHLHVR